MDNMVLEGSLVQKACRALIRRYLKRKFGVDPEVIVNNMQFKYSNGQLHVNFSGYAGIDHDTAWTIISTLLSAGRA